jgi:hypothetical protein
MAKLLKLQWKKCSDGEALIEIKQIIKTTEGEKTLNGEKLSFKSTMDEEFQTIRNDYVKSLTKNIKKRLQKRDGDLLNDFSLVLEPLSVNSADITKTENSVENLASFYGHEKTTKIVEGNLIEGTIEHKKIIQPLLDEVQLKTEWVRLKGMIKGSY